MFRVLERSTAVAAERGHRVAQLAGLVALR